MVPQALRATQQEIISQLQPGATAKVAFADSWAEFVLGWAPKAGKHLGAAIPFPYSLLQMVDPKVGSKVSHQLAGQELQPGLGRSLRHLLLPPYPPGLLTRSYG